MNTTGACPYCGFDPAATAGKYPLALKPGSVLNGRYILGHVLGQGGFGITYIAWDDNMKERVAIKEYLPTEFAGRSTGSPSVLVYSDDRAENFAYGMAQFLEEAKTLATFIGDSHIVRIYSYFEENGTAYMSMEYVDGLPLDKYMAAKGGRLSPEEANRLLLPLTESLEAVHAQGIVHRDISPDNVLVTKDGRAKLIDFGAARYSTGEKSKSLDVILKHGFAPYEQYMRRGRQGPWTDVYALAATWYYAVTGRIPPESVERVQEDVLVPPSALGVRLGKAEDVLLHALELFSSERIQSMGEFRRAMLEASGTPEAPPQAPPPAKAAPAQERPVPVQEESAEPEGGPSPAAQKPKKSKLPLILGAVAVLALAVCLIVFLPSSPSTGGAKEAENAAALFQEGEKYYYGLGVAQDYAKALEWYTKAADAGNADAMNNIGFLYENGYGVEQDYAKALEWYRKAADAGSVGAMTNIGFLYERGYGIEQNYAKAMEWYTRAANIGDTLAITNIGFLYERGYGIEQNYAKAMEWYTRAADAGNALAMSNIGFLYLNGYGVEQDYAIALEWFTKAADAGNADAMNNIGFQYCNGYGVEQDYAKALEWYTKAADAGNADAMNNIGFLYLNGYDVEQDYAIALEWYTKAADAGNTLAMNNIGWLYEHGYGVEKDQAKAEEWYARAREAGYTG
ncbi:MAG: protein kinase [Oscillospiraceae bacterium]|nr:protein kinase [Oscillospiraceae bacterium]